MDRRVPASQKRNQGQSGEWPGEEGKGDEPFTTGLPLLGRKGDTGLTLAVLVCPSSPCPSLSGHLSRLWSSGDPCDRAFLNWKRLGRRQEGHAKQDSGGGEGMSQLPRGLRFVAPEWPAERTPGSLCVCVGVGGNQLFPVPMQRGPPHTSQGPVPQARALGLSLTPLFCQLPHPTPAS